MAGSYSLTRGHRVFILDIAEDELKYTVEVHLKKYAPNISYGICNLRDTDDIRRNVKKAAEFFGGCIDVLINNGGIAAPKWKDGKTMEDEDTLDEWKAYMETNLTAPFVVSQACIPFMKVPEDHTSLHGNAGPCIIHIGSFRAYTSDPDQEGYASTKAGQLGLMHSMAISCGRWGIRVNLVAPGRIKVDHECKEGDEKGEGWQQTDADIEQVTYTLFLNMRSLQTGPSTRTFQTLTLAFSTLPSAQGTPRTLQMHAGTLPMQASSQVRTSLSMAGRPKRKALDHVICCMCTRNDV